jgi:protein-S-isoprenylcysteine O-methyltransferase Ste14
MKALLCSILFTLLAIQGFAQEQAPEMADALRASGKIYVVVCVAAIVMVGLIIYLISIDRKIAKLEKEAGIDKDK